MDLLRHLKSPVFQNILSIGYEFETHNLSKLSLSKDQTRYYSNDNSNFRSVKYAATKQKVSDQLHQIVKDDFEETICAQKDKTETEFCFFSDVGKYRHPHISSLCEGTSEIKRTNWWTIQQGEQERDITFITPDHLPCNYFPNLEWNITFYKITGRQNIVLDTFKESVDLIINQIKSMGQKKVKLINRWTKLNINTLLIGDTFLLTGKNPFMIKPQLTFTCKIENVIGIIRGFLLEGIKNRELTDLYEMIQFVEECPSDKAAQGYLFLIMLMVKAYERNKVDGFSKYLKNYIYFLPRHKIIHLYWALEHLDKSALQYGISQGPPYFSVFLRTFYEGPAETNINEQLRNSTIFELKNDVVFIEVRIFGGILGYFLNSSPTLDLLLLQEVLNPGEPRNESALRKRFTRHKKKRSRQSVKVEPPT